LGYFVAIWNILWPFGIFPPFWYVEPRKIWQPWLVGDYEELQRFYINYRAPIKAWIRSHF
jgi:hypothetical protein